ncbi:MAG: serine/threonine-protein kinase [Planctomycetota bacterium]|nr:serine/threonine-protein kinase [Planctomycetota bacterium]
MPFEQLGPYRIEHTIGRGGMGTVYSGVHAETGQNVAVKVLSLVLGENERFRERFQIEIATLEKLDHKNIVRLVGFGEHDGHLFYSMELVEGRNLQQELKTGRRFQWREAARIGMQICDALKHAHDHGVIHRDLKPSNLLYTSDEHIKLTDFGIAKLFGASQMTADGSALGTADYMSPEQATGKPVSTKTDLYGLGGVLFALISGRPPYLGASAPEVLHRVQFDEVPSIRNLVPEVPAEFDEIIQELLHKDPAKRIATPLLVAKQLRAMDLALADDNQVEEPLRPEDLNQGINLEQVEFSDSEIALQPTLPIAYSHATNERQQGATDTPTKNQNLPGSQSTQPGITRRKRRDFTSVTAKRSGTSATWSQATAALPWNTLLPAMALVAVVAGMVWAVLNTLSPESIEDQFEQISDAHESGLADPRSQESKMRSFLKASKNKSRSKLVQEWLTEIEAVKHARRLERQTRQLGGVAFLPPEDQAFLLAWRTRQSNLDLARKRFQQLVDAFGALPEKSQQVALVVRLAQHELKQIESTPPSRNNDQSQRLQAYVEQLDASLSGEAKNRALTGIIDLFKGQLWAEHIVRDCQRRLTISQNPEGDNHD